MIRMFIILLPLTLLIACGDKDDSACEDAEKACDGDILQECVDGAWEETDCEADGMICHDMGDDSHCMMDGEMEM